MIPATALGESAAVSPDATRFPHLNAQQRAAVEHGVAQDGATPGVAGPLLVIAGAGTGKTSTLAHRVAHLIAQGADPRGILLLTFSRRAALEMGRRVARIVAGIDRQGAGLAQAALGWSGTFHGIGARLLREYAPHLGLSPSFSIHDREDSADLLALVRHDLGLSTRDKRFPTKQTCLAIYSRVINTQAPLDQVLQASFPWCADWEDALKSLFAAYVEAKQREAVLDYDDLLLYWQQMLTEPSLAASVGERFQHVFVDEYQDTNPLQAAVLLALKPDGRGVTVVGDDAQSIYAFRGATVANIFAFPQLFDPPAHVVKLERNYRSTPGILAASNGVIGLASERYEKNLWTQRPDAGKPELVTVRDEADQARYVVRQVLERRERGMLLKQQAVLFRTAHHSATLEIELTRCNVPFVKFGGLKFLEAAHVKDLLAILRWVENPRDRVAGYRVLLLIPGVGPRTAGKLLDRLMSDHEDPLAVLQAFTPAGQAAAQWSGFVGMVMQVRNTGAGWPGELDVVRNWYEPLLENRYEDAMVRAADLEQIVRIAATYPSRERFLSELTLDPPDASSDESGVPMLDEDYLVLSTIHSAKGQEWEAVYVLNVVDGCIPSDLATGTTLEIEEERRLLYVAMTRAKNELSLLTPQRFYVQQQPGHGDRHVHAGCTRFIPRSLLALFEATAWPLADPPARNTPPSPPPQAFIDLAARMRKMWQ